MACLAKPEPILKPAAPGTPRLVIIRDKLPANVCSDFSSNVVRSSKNFSTFAAWSVPRPKSIKDAPREKAPFGISIKPAP